MPVWAQTPATREQRDSRYQLGMMEGVLEKAVEHGAALMRERLRTVLPAEMLLSRPPRARGIRSELAALLGSEHRHAAFAALLAAPAP